MTALRDAGRASLSPRSLAIVGASAWSIGRRAIAVGGLLWCASACPGRSDGEPFPPPGAGDRGASDPGVGRVGNQVRGFDAIPDWDAEARRTREDVIARLPDPLPEADAACRDMLAAAIAHYESLDGAQGQSVAQLRTAQAEDLRACREQTTPAAATCVTILLADHGGEYPWLLDQCSRAFPSPS
jgi:hypothetical protein